MNGGLNLACFLRNPEEQEIISKDKRDRRDYEQVSNLAKRMGLYRYQNVIHTHISFLVFNLVFYLAHCL